jgi:hypothetical protein
MEITAECTTCKQKIIVSGPDPPPQIFQDFPIIVNCPACDWPNVVAWRKRTPYSVSLSEKTK